MSDPAAAILALAGSSGARSLVVVGTSKNAGKSVVIRALADGLARTGRPYGLCSIGRDGEAVDALDGGAKPRFFLRPGAVVALPAALVPRSPALEFLADSGETSALGRILVARVRAPGYVEVAGPPSASALRRVIRALEAIAGFVLVDGAVDRLAALAGGEDAVVVAVGAASAPTLALAADGAAALVARLRLPVRPPGDDVVRIAGALTAADAFELIRRGESRPIVVADATHAAFGGRTFATIAARLDLRVERAIRPVACTVAPLGRDRTFEPEAFARAVAERTGLPTFDVFASTAIGLVHGRAS